MLGEVEKAASEMMSNMFSQENWNDMEQTEDLLLPSLNLQDPVNIEMEDLEKRNGSSPLGFAFSSLQDNFLSSLSHTQESVNPSLSPHYADHVASPAYSAPTEVTSPQDLLSPTLSPSRVPSPTSPCPIQPVQRTRCNTWPRVMQNQDMFEGSYKQDAGQQPCQSQQTYYNKTNSTYGYQSNPSPQNQLPLLSEEPASQQDSSPVPGGNLKQKTSRRNPWGNYSYADLITQAIQSSPDQRLTLAQIYDWLINNIPYFKERSDVSTSAGWKNSIRHNLSLHLKFLKVQNEGTGKSSWWTLAPESKPGSKTPRRRAASMECNKLKRERERTISKVKARLERTSSTNSTGSNSANSSGFPTVITPTEPSSPTHYYRGLEYRTRTNSSASTDSSFRARASSDASPPPSLLDFSISQFGTSSSGETDLDNIHLDNLNIQPGNIIREYLHPECKPPLEQTETETSNTESDFLYQQGLERRSNVTLGYPITNLNTSPISSQETKHKLTILEPRENHTPYSVQQYSVLQQQRYTVPSSPCDVEGLVEEYNANIAGYLGCTDERFEREKEIKRQKMILMKIDELNHCVSQTTSEEEMRRTRLMLNLLQEMVDKSSRPDVKEEEIGVSVLDPYYQESIPEETEVSKSTEQTYSIYNQIIQNTSLIKEEFGGEEIGSEYNQFAAVDESNIKLDDSCLQQIERILCP